MRAHLQRLVVVLLLVLVLVLSASTSAASTRSSDPAWLVRAFACIHRYEGRWDDPNPPYYGGLQMDWNFMRAYGAEFLRAWGTADHWPPSVQIAVAIRAYLSGRGFAPWPNTARACGLI